MTFADLPDDWSHLPLHDPVLRSDVVDLFVSSSDRVRRSLLLLLCDEEGRALQPVVINDLRRREEAPRRAAMFELLDHLAMPAVVVALALPHASPSDREVRSWAGSARATCERLGTRLVGFHLATLDGVWDADAA